MALAMDTLAWLLLAAFVAGFIDAMAGGGGLLTLPALLAAGVPPVPAIATNKLQGCFGTGGAFMAYWRRGLVDLRAFAGAAGVAFAGSAAGAVAVQHADPAFVAGVVPVLLRRRWPLPALLLSLPAMSWSAATSIASKRSVGPRNTCATAAMNAWPSGAWVRSRMPTMMLFVYLLFDRVDEHRGHVESGLVMNLLETGRAGHIDFGEEIADHV